MTMNPRGLLAVMTGVTLLAGTATALTSAADPSPLQQANAAYRDTCLHFKGDGGADYLQDAPKNPHMPHATNTFSSGGISVQPTLDPTGTLQVSTASCQGVEYELQVSSVDGSSLQATNITATSTANGPAAVSDNGNEVDIVWSGDGQTSSFAAAVTTGWKYDAAVPGSTTAPCVNTRFHVIVAGQDVTDPAMGAGTLCLDLGSGGGFTYAG